VLGPWFNQLSGEDASALDFMAHGGHGCISMTANVAPHICAEFQHACLRHDFASALGLHDRLMPLHTALFLETSPAPVKYALSVLGKCREILRPAAGAGRRADTHRSPRRHGVCRPGELIDDERRGAARGQTLSPSEDRRVDRACSIAPMIAQYRVTTGAGASQPKR